MDFTFASRDSSGPAQRLLATLNNFLLRAVPVVSARTLAVCRILFAGLVLFFWINATVPESLSEAATSGPSFRLNNIQLVIWLSATPVARDIVYYSVAAGLAALLVGFASRVTYPILVATFWLAALMMNRGHVMTPLLLAMTVTLPARWSDAWSVDRWLGLAKPLPGRSNIYGWPIWLLGLCIALAYFTAGFSKLVITRGAWIWDTGARWGFIVDLRDATTSWGLYFIDNYWLALAASVFSSFGQIAYLWAAFTTSARVKAVIGLGIALPFLIGLAVFMGLFWWPWAVLVLILYLPWRMIDRVSGDMSVTQPVAPIGLRWASAVAVLLIAAHAAAILSRRELEPLISNYPMYALPFAANSEAERDEWKKYKTYDRHFRYSVKIQTPNGRIEDRSDDFSWASFAARYSLVEHAAARFAPERVLNDAARGAPVSEGVCADLRQLVGATASNVSPIVIYGRNYYDLINGKIAWRSDPREVKIRVGSKCEYE